MKRFTIRCDYCGVFHKVKIENDSIIEVENHSAISFEIAEDIEDVQLLNNYSKESDEPGDSISTGVSEPPR